ncbi:MAG: tetratricopeptide repeat protein [Polaribacter sp.]|uniref:tetratricopeptide repeat protein n=1 Tax=Polaribacter sp. TaxID=1920175 RepID=UPI002F360A8D
MKKQLLTLALGLMTIGAYAQKSELKIVEKAVKKSQFAAALSAITSLESSVGSMDAKYKAKYYYLKGQTLAGSNNFEGASEAFNNLFAFEEEIGKQKYTKYAKPMLDGIIQKVSNKAVKLYNDDKNFSEAAKSFYLTYKLSPKDTSFLYNAAISASQAKEYDTSLKYYKEAKEVGYTGITTQYFAVNKETGKEESLGTKANRDTMVKLGQYIKPTQKTSESKQADIVKNIGYIYVNQGKPELAITALDEARKANPKDVNLILNQAQMYIKLDKMDKFGELMEEAVKLDPTNPNLFFNLGVVNQNQGKIVEAEEFYKKAIELKPDYSDAYLNLSIAILAGDKQIVDEMNENFNNEKKYNELQKKQKEIYNKALPYLEKADDLKRTVDTVRVLLNIYDNLEMEAKGDKLRAIYKEMKGQ